MSTEPEDAGAVVGLPPPPPPVARDEAVLPIDVDAVRPSGGQTLIVRGGTVLPPVCLATGAGGEMVRVEGSENWASAWVLLLFLLRSRLKTPTPPVSAALPSA